MKRVSPNTREKEIFSTSDMLTLSMPLWVFDLDSTQLVWANEAACKLWQAKSIEELLSRDLSEDISSSVAERMKKYRDAAKENGQTFRELWTLYPEGKPCPYHIHISGHELPDGRYGLRFEATADFDRMPEQIRSAEALNHIPVCVSLFNMRGKPLYNNPAALETYGDTSLEMRDRFARKSDHDKFLRNIAKGRTISKICEVHTKDGKRWHEITGMRGFDGLTGQNACIITETDVTELKEKESRVRYLAHYDMLTGLHNRNYVNSHYPERIQSAFQENERLVLMIVGLDHFKAINETLGHPSGDALLKHVASQLEMSLQETEQIARLGGDEFVILAPYRSTTDLDIRCQTILASINEECTVGDHILSANASIGLVLFPEHGRDLPTLLRHCDLALHDAKDSGRNTYRFYRPALQQAALAKRALEKDLVRAVENEEFCLFYQPRVDCQTQEIVSAEALMRWQHPEKGLVFPGDFIGALEDTGLIHRVGDWIADRAGKDQRTIARLGYNIPISINISPKQFERPDFVHRLKCALAKSGCPADKIEIEITESMLMGVGFDAKAILMDLCRAGFSIAVDDFGTGYSNLAYIQDYPISSLKVDRSFVNMIEDQSSVINLILSLCRLIGISAVAEGVETVDQLAWLRMNHCDQYQGYLYSRPVPLDNLIELMTTSHQRLMSSRLPESLDAEVIWA
nr:EAL domain-containing protein [uncultured Cohaesibacter sp.]